jgi:hypothetical protein
MKRIHVLGVALLLGLAAVLGLVAATRTTGVARHAQPRTSDAAIVARARRLNQVEFALRRALRDRPPALPPVPSASAPAPVAAPQVVYRRPAPIVLVKHTSHHDDGHESESEGGGGGD